MTRPIQTLPVGLLGSLGLKSMGTNPVDFLEQVRGIVDLWPLYMEASARYTASNGGPFPIGDTALGRTPGFVPEQNQAWWIHGGEMTLYVPATATATLVQVRLDRNLVADPSQHTTVVPTLTLAPIAASTVAREYSVPIPGGFILEPSESVTAVLSAEGVAVAPVQWRYGLRYTPFPV